MAKNISAHSIFGDYNGPENRLTAAFLHILNRGDEPLLRYVLSAANNLLPDNEISICTQQSLLSGKQKMVFDGVISCDFRFSFIVESKIISNSLTKAQVDKYHKANPSATLVALTPDCSRPTSLHSDDIWMNWTFLSDILNMYEDENQDELLRYLIEQFELLLNNLNLYDDWSNRVVVVGGSWGEPIALKYGFYSCQNNRYFKQAKYLAFAYNNKIKHLFEIVGTPSDNVDLTKVTSVDPKYFADFEPGYKPGNLRKFFELKKIADLNITNDNVSKTGRKCAFTQRQKYTTYEKIINAKMTSEL